MKPAATATKASGPPMSMLLVTIARYNGDMTIRPHDPQARESPPFGLALLLHRAVALLREARWISRERVMICGALFTALTLVLLAAGAVSHTKNRYTAANGEQLGLDFINYFVGAKAAAGGEAALVYDRTWLRSAEERVTGPAAPRMYSYPPITLLLSLPLALFSFVPALIFWVAAGAAACFAALRRIVGWRAAALATIGPPAAFFNIYGGQNAYFTAALLAGGVGALERRPVLAGMCFGALAYKPHMAAMLPLALAATARWRTLAAAAATALLLALASLALLGLDAWRGFLAQLPIEHYFLDVEAPLLHRLPTVFVALRALGVSSALAYEAQLVSAALAAGAVIVAWRSRASLDTKAAALVLATFLATPHAWDYDEVALVFAAAWLWRDATRTGFRPWERLAIVTLLVLPMPSIMIGAAANLEPGPIVLWLTLLLILRRALDPASAAQGYRDGG